LTERGRCEPGGCDRNEEHPKAEGSVHKTGGAADETFLLGRAEDENQWRLINRQLLSEPTWTRCVHVDTNNTFA
jgi:hypothetical protein